MVVGRSHFQDTGSGDRCLPCGLGGGQRTNRETGARVTRRGAGHRETGFGFSYTEGCRDPSLESGRKARCHLLHGFDASRRVRKATRTSVAACPRTGKRLGKADETRSTGSRATVRRLSRVFAVKRFGKLSRHTQCRGQERVLLGAGEAPGRTPGPGSIFIQPGSNAEGTLLRGGLDPFALNKPEPVPMKPPHDLQ